MTGLKEIFAYNLKEIRHKSGLTQAELAEKVNVSTHHIGMLEIARNFPALDLVERIAAALNTECYRFFINPLSPPEELEHLYQTVARNIERVVAAAIEKTLSAHCQPRAATGLPVAARI